MLYLVLCFLFLALAFGAEYKTVENKVPREYIVVLKQALKAEHADINSQLDEHLKSTKGKVLKMPKVVAGTNETDPYTIQHEYRDLPGFTGYGAIMDPETVAILLEDELVDYVEESTYFYASQQCLRQTTDTWGLIRTTTLNSVRQNNYDYHNLNFGGTIDVYVVDTGIRLSHTEFQGRAVFGTDTTTQFPPRTDQNGHGTHVAGTVGGQLFGIAKGATLIDVRVLAANGSGTTNGIIAGINWVAGTARNRRRTAIANLSLGGGWNLATNQAVDAATAANVLMVTASGNERQNGCNVSPGSASTALNVNAADISDNIASFSNFGTCTHIFAPGVDIRSAWHTSNTAVNVISGTSMAAPHVAGVAAKLLALNRGHTAASLRSTILNMATRNVIRFTNGSPNVNLRMACP